MYRVLAYGRYGLIRAYWKINQSEVWTLPLFQSGQGQAPVWGELNDFEIVRLAKGENHTFERKDAKEKLIVAGGSCCVMFAGNKIFALERSTLSLNDDKGIFRVDSVQEDTTLVRLWGRWGEELGGSGVFKVVKAEQLVERGDPVSYPKETNFDSHYHDCDEYWILVEGRGVAVSEGRHYEVGPGDCVATGMGHHHDFPIVYEPVKAVFFETTMDRQKRKRHLWNHTHGTAVPVKERV
jgi:mannose-6-phosphate isomerase-like protein (cupin superfamily)